ncbi:hypothetical protein [Emticicia sp. BO119]|uniref:hypothetical protein n=1 Tax=Emticicia sp. BO119 TaxID=2757768 RepID=UPI0015EFDC3A|nr:hypothetical protein [Emticicia sp. BO119]MBA4849007.1 hypothetical protein [Emticicia sp. BO119]
MLHTDVNSTPQSEKAFPYMDRSVYAHEPFNKHLNTKIQGSLFEHIQGNLGFLGTVSIQDFVRNLLSDFFEGNLVYTTLNIAETTGNLKFPQVSTVGNLTEISGFPVMETEGNLNEIGFLEQKLLALYQENPNQRTLIGIEEYELLSNEYNVLLQQHEAMLGEAAGAAQVVVLSLEELLAISLTDEKIEDILEMANQYENAFDLIKEKYGARELE